MSSFWVIPNVGLEQTFCFDWCENETLKDLKRRLLSSFSFEDETFFITHQGFITKDTQVVIKDGVYRVCPRILGGKGGFGSMLRAIGAQIEKTTNREACRDLSGRRMRDVNNEKKLKEWIGKKADRERERERIRKERLARRLAVPKHNFDDPQYEDQKSKVTDNLEDALQTGLNKILSKEQGAAKDVSMETLGKRSAESSEAGPSKAKVPKKSMEWMGIDVGSDSGSDISDSDFEGDNESKHDNGNILGDGPSGNSGSEKISRVSGDNLENIGANHETDELRQMVDQHAEVQNASSSLLSSLPPPTSSSPQQSEKAYGSDPASLELEKFSSAEELEQFGLDTLKAVLMSRGLKCGGTLHERAHRLFSVKGLKPEDIPPLLLAKPQRGKSGKKMKS